MSWVDSISPLKDSSLLTKIVLKILWFRFLWTQCICMEDKFGNRCSSIFSGSVWNGSCLQWTVRTVFNAARHRIHPGMTGTWRFPYNCIACVYFWPQRCGAFIFGRRAQALSFRPHACFYAWFPATFLSASLYFSKRGAYWDRLCRDVVGRWLVVTRVHCGQTVHPRPIFTMEH